MSLAFGSTQVGLVLAELQAAIVANVARSMKQVRDQSADPSELTAIDLAHAVAEANSQSAELANIFADRFAAEGNSQWEGLIRQWANELTDSASELLDAIDSQDEETIKDVVAAALATFDDGGVLDNIIGRNFGTTLLVKGFKVVDVVRTGDDVLEAWRNGDSTKIAGLGAGIAFGFFAGKAAVAAITAVAGGVPALIALAAAGAVVAVTGDALSDGVDFLLEGFWSQGQDDEDVASVISRLVMSSGQAYLPGVDYRLAFGTAGNDVILPSESERNTIVGGSGNDNITGGGKDDYLSGGADNDVLDGGDGNDRLLGGDGADTLRGGLGADTLEGGEGFDTYAFVTSDFSQGDQDIIIDSDGVGRITFNGLDISGTGTGFSGIRSATSWSWETSDRSFLLTVAGTSANSSLVIQHRGSGSRIVVKDWSNGDLGISIPGLWQPGTPSNPFPQTNGNDLVGRDGDSESPASGDDHILGMAGNDGIDGGYGDDWIDGGHDDDLILGGPGSNRLIGGLGNDVILSYSVVANWREFENPESAYANLAARSDVISYGNGWHVYVANGTPNLADAGHQLSRLQVAGWGPQSSGPWVHPDPNIFKNGDDDIEAGDGDDIAYAGEGNDVISGGFGRDLLVGGADNDQVDGGDGDDVILGDDFTHSGTLFNFLSTVVSSSANAAGNDVLKGGDGDDRIYGQGGDDVIEGGDGNDLLQGDRIDYGLANSYELNVQSGNDYIDGGDGDDEIYGDGGDDTLLGGEGNDVIVGDSIGISSSLHGADTISGGGGSDVLVGLGGNDTINGDDGDDVIFGDGELSDVALIHHGNDTINGGAGNDTLHGNGGDDIIKGDEGNDLIFGDEGNDRLLGGAGLDQLIGGDGNDSLDGGAGNDKLWGENGDDILSGGDGDDELQGGDGIDHLNGGNGDDKLWGDAGNDILVGGEGNDQLAGGTGADRLDGGSGNDILNGNAGDDVLFGGSGNDNISGNEGDDVIHGDAGDDALFGQEGHDSIQGGAGHDLLSGGSGNDVLEGGDGNDTLIGGAGEDTLVGGAGNDVYIVSVNASSDVIDNSHGGFDGILFSDGMTIDRLWFGRDGDDLVIHADAATSPAVRVLNHFLGGESAIDYVEMAGGYSLVTSQINAIVNGGGGGAQFDQVIVGTANSEQIVGTWGRDLIRGLGGHDDLYGMGGNDTLQGGDGDDYLYGGNGSFSGSGADTLIGGAGDDVLIGEDGNDLLVGGTGNDIYYYLLGSGSDTVDNVGGGTDWLYFADVSANRLGFHRQGDDLIVRVDGDPNQQIRVLKHFQGGEYAISFVQPGTGNAIAASQIPGLLLSVSGFDQGGSFTDSDVDGSASPIEHAFSKESSETPIFRSRLGWDVSKTSRLIEGMSGVEAESLDLTIGGASVVPERSNSVATVTRLFPENSGGASSPFDPSMPIHHGGREAAQLFEFGDSRYTSIGGVATGQRNTAGVSPLRPASTEIDQLISAMAGFRDGQAGGASFSVDRYEPMPIYALQAM